MSSLALAIVGPTATGKSALALALARAAGDVELVSVDAMQVYRGMDVGTAKPTLAERAEVAHHGLDLVEPDEAVTVVRVRAEVDAALEAIAARRRRAVLVGGTGLHLRAVIDRLEPPGRWPAIAAGLETEPDPIALHRRLGALDPLAAARIEPTNRRRTVRALEVCLGSGRRFSSFGPGLEHYPPTPVAQIGLRVSRPVLAARIEARVHAMVAAGWLEEVRALHARPGGLSPTARQALGYAELLDHLDGRTSLEVALERTVARTRRFATRQERWFRRDPRITWVDVDDDPLAALPLALRVVPPHPVPSLATGARTACA